MSDNTEKAIDAAADVAGEMAEQMEGVENIIRSLNRAKVQFYLMGMAIGGLTAGIIAYKVAYSRAETKYSKIADAEIEEMRTHYAEKAKALEGEAAKGDLESLVAEKGYLQEEEEVQEEPPPMAVKPPVVVKPATPAPDRLPPKPPEADEAEVRNIFQEAEVTHEWDWVEERKKRSPDIPYVVHIDERDEFEYDSETLTYYEGDDVLCNERDEIIDPDIRDTVVGEANLNRFGHGSGDAAIVYVRNDKLGLLYEIVRSPNYFAEEVHGFHHSGYGKNLERMRLREKHEQED